MSCITWVCHVIHDSLMLYMTWSCNIWHTHIIHELIMYYMVMSCMTWEHYYMRTPCNTWHFTYIIWVLIGLRASKFAGHVSQDAVFHAPFVRSEIITCCNNTILLVSSLSGWPWSLLPLNTYNTHCITHGTPHTELDCDRQFPTQASSPSKSSTSWTTYLNILGPLEVA